METSTSFTSSLIQNSSAVKIPQNQSWFDSKSDKEKIVVI